MLKKENVFIITILLLPFILLLMILKFTNVLTDYFYNYIIIISILFYLFMFIESLFFMLDDIINSKKKLRIILVILIPLIYIPIFYLKNISRDDKYLSYIIFFLNIGLITGVYFCFKKSLTNYYIENEAEKIIIKETFDYSSKNNEFTIKINSDYICDNTLDGYVIACDNNSNDSFIGIYSYKDNNFSQGKLDDIMSFHFEEILRVINENNYESNIEYLDNYVKINYNNMSVLLTQRNYFFTNTGYSLIIIMEASENEENIKDLENVIETIQFLN